VRKQDRVVEDLVSELEKIQYKQAQYHRELDDYLNVTPARRIRIEIQLDVLAAEERGVTRRLLIIEGCEHGNVEDTGGPDGSQVCMDCGKVR
jgi:hypothetical protein